jgi:hypothetical protein
MRFLFVFAAAAFAAVLLLYNSGKKEEAEFLLRAMTGLGVLVAVVVAVYGDAIKNRANRIRLRIRDPEQTDNFFNRVGTPYGEKTAFCHHLRVENLSPHHPVENCRVWLVKILDRNSEGTFEEAFRFAVPRLMVWAPGEYSPDVRSFSEDQVFDLGRTFVEEGRFEINYSAGQGGLFKGSCESGNSRQYVFRMTADNYIRANYVTVQVSVRNVEATEEWPYTTRADVEVLT